jgi:hypothetical protein
MSVNTFREFFAKLGAKPFQVDFASTYFETESRKHTLSALSGLGKSFTCSAIVGYATSKSPNIRALILAPPAVASYWVDLIETVSPNGQCMLVDGRSFRKLAFDSPEDPFGVEGVVIMSTSTAKKPSVLDALTRTRWDILVVEETQSMALSTDEVITKLLATNQEIKSIFIQNYSTFTQSITSSASYLTDASPTVWSHDTVVNTTGQPLLRKADLAWVTYFRPMTEIKILTVLQDTLRTTYVEDSDSALELLRKASSSIFALQTAVGNADYDEGWVGDANDVLPIAIRERIDDLLSNSWLDYKLDALVNLLIEIPVSESGQTCIFTCFDETATYLQGALSDKSESNHKVDNFFVSTLIGDTMLPELDAVIFYDIPPLDSLDTAHVLYLVRSEHVKLFAIEDQTGVLVLERIQKRIIDNHSTIDLHDMKAQLFSDS